MASSSSSTEVELVCGELSGSELPDHKLYEYAPTSIYFRCTNSRDDGYITWFNLDGENLTMVSESIWQPRFSTIVGLDSYIYVVGGINPYPDNAARNTVYTFDTQYPHYGWKSVTPMIVPRKNPVAVSVCGKIFVFGGCSCGPFWAECYDPCADSWHILPDLFSSFLDFNDWGPFFTATALYPSSILVNFNWLPKAAFVFDVEHYELRLVGNLEPVEGMSCFNMSGSMDGSYAFESTQFRVDWNGQGLLYAFNYNASTLFCSGVPFHHGIDDEMTLVDSWPKGTRALLSVNGKWGHVPHLDLLWLGQALDKNYNHLHHTHFTFPFKQPISKAVEGPEERTFFHGLSCYAKTDKIALLPNKYFISDGLLMEKNTARMPRSRD